mgnify:FL=1
MPFFAGITGMKWRRFAPFSILGGLTWSSIFTLLGYFFGGIPTVQRHFELVIVGILLISLIPTFVGLIKAKTNSSKRKKAAQAVANDSEAAEEAEATAASDIA